MSPAAVVSSAGTGELCFRPRTLDWLPYLLSTPLIGLMLSNQEGLPADGLCQHACSRVKSHTTGLQPIAIEHAPATAL
jgi:hypothetical protein